MTVFPNPVLERCGLADKYLGENRVMLTDAIGSTVTCNVFSGEVDVRDVARGHGCFAQCVASTSARSCVYRYADRITKYTVRSRSCCPRFVPARSPYNSIRMDDGYVRRGQERALCLSLLEYRRSAFCWP
ncbi:MAG: hypothetical protein IPF79_05765 [Ignavibacteria bacterium]|nr:hypothetical protein [Ignavibacteria bacterium]